MDRWKDVGLGRERNSRQLESRVRRKRREHQGNRGAETQRIVSGGDTWADKL